MKRKEILDIAKELILITVKYRKIKNTKDKEKILNIFSNYESKLKNNKTKYAEIILGFLLDLKDDLKSWRELNIDNSSSDEYLENYLLTKNELKIYNNLIIKDSYKIIFDELNKKKFNNKLIDKNLDLIIKNFIKNLKLLNLKLIAKNLLIFTYFERQIAKDYLINLYLFLKTPNQKRKINDLIVLYNEKIKEIKSYAINYYIKNDFNYKYLWFKNVDWKTILHNNIVDTSKTRERTGFYKYEYKKIINLL